MPSLSKAQRMAKQRETAARWSTSSGCIESTIAAADSAAPGAGLDAAAGRDAALLDSLTERISTRLRDEMRRMPREEQTDMSTKMEQYVEGSLCCCCCSRCGAALLLARRHDCAAYYCNYYSHALTH